MFSWLANLPVARKLMIGFGLLCLMSVLIFCAGRHAIDSLSYRMDRMSAVNRLMDDFSKLRQERSAFVESEGGGQAANELKEKIRQVARTWKHWVFLHPGAEQAANRGEWPGTLPLTRRTSVSWKRPTGR
ncbi:methyl-accepting chemotaxis protein [Pseudomonas bharatica]|uniref:methyl-accepting chemotaxis protein n=1 Tax=Pseudomonas bharatica TaxID=2692112 RepID=UPI0024C0CC14|nr:methyl-accepting chemotaxis protein [Pseudomonas bharatica]